MVKVLACQVKRYGFNSHSTQEMLTFKKNNLLINNYTYKLTICDFSQNLILKKILIIQNFFLIKWKSSLKIFIKNCLVKKSKKFTLLKAPFVHKKAREQFLLEIFFQILLFCFKFKISKLLNIFIFKKIKLDLKFYNINYVKFSFFFKKKVIAFK